MAKDKLSIDSLETRLTSIEKNQTRDWNALSTIAERMGMSLTDNGKYFMESDNETMPRMSQQSSGGAAPAPAQQPAIDVGTFATAVVEEFNDNPPAVKFKEQCIPVDIQSVVEGNKWLYETVTKPWDERDKKYRQAYLRLHGYKEVKVGDDVILAVDDHPEVPPNPLIEDSPNRTTEKANTTPSSIRGMLAAICRRLWQDAVSFFWKTFAYSIALVAIIIGVFAWWEQKRQANLLSTEIKIYRLVLVECYEDGHETLESLDRDLKNDGPDKTYKMLKQCVEERERKRHREQAIKEGQQKHKYREQALQAELKKQMHLEHAFNAELEKITQRQGK